MPKFAPPGYSAPPPAVAIPANFEVEEKLAGPFTARQCAILAATAVVSLVLAEVLRHTAHLSPPMLAGCATPLVFLGLVLAVAQPGGIPADVLLTSAIRFLRTGRRQAHAADRVPLPSGVRRLAPLYTGVTEQDGTGIAWLDGSQQATAVLEVQPVCLNLADATEAATALGVIGHVLASQTGPATVSTITERINLNEHADTALAFAEQLPEPRLSALAVAYAGYLRDLADGRELWHRRYLITMRQLGPGAETVAANRAHIAAETLTACGMSATVLDAAALTALLVTACDPQREHSVAALAAPDQTIRALPLAPLPFLREAQP